MIILFLLLLSSESFIINIPQEEVYLGEPFILEANVPFGEIPYLNEVYIEFEGNEHYCLNLYNELEKHYMGFKRINIADLIKSEGEWTISIIYDALETCKEENLSEEEKEKNKEIKEEMKRAKEEKRFQDSMYLLSLLKYDREEEREKLKKEGSFMEFGKKKVKVNYPTGFDKGFYLNNLKGRSKEFWERYNEEIEELLKRKESVYFPWAVYLELKKGLSFSYDKIRSDEDLENIKKDFNFIMEGLMKKDRVNFIEAEWEKIKKYMKGWKQWKNCTKVFHIITR